jgi:hypothetical protein
MAKIIADLWALKKCRELSPLGYKCDKDTLILINFINFAPKLKKTDDFFNNIKRL